MITDEINQITNRLDCDMFLTTTARKKLLDRLEELVEQRKRYRKTIKEYSNEKNGNLER